MTGEQFKEWRLRNKMTQDQAGIIFDVDRRTILGYEKSTSIPWLVEIACEWYEKVYMSENVT